MQPEVAMKTETYEVQIGKLLEQLTLEEKIGMIHGAGLFRTEGVERLSIPPLFFSDGPMGVRAEFADNEWRNTGTTDDFVSYLPCNSAVASTWNRELAGEEGRVLGEEARGRGKDMILAPGINIKRSPFCGRNFEYMSEDPETERLWVDTKVSKQTLEEIYFPGFRAAVQKGGVHAVMGAYNLLNGEHCCTSKKLLNGTLRRDWGFDGVVVSDWGGVHDTREAAEAALDVEMEVTYDFDQQYLAEPLLKMVRSGEISEAFIDEKVRNILRLMFRLHMIGEKRETRKTGTYNSREHQETVLKIARESVVLLKNEEECLPLEAKKVKRVAVIGQNAAAIHSNGGGSAEIKALYEISPLLGIKKLLGGNVKVEYAPGYYIPGKEAQGSVNWQADSTKKDWGKSSEETEASDETKECRKRFREEAVALAKECDTVIFVGGLNHDFDSEGYDRTTLMLPYEQDALIGELLAVRPDTVIVLYAGSPVAMPWNAQAKAVLWSYYAGMEGGTAIAEILFGKGNPSGRLAESFPKDANECPAHTIGTFAKKDVVEYKEGVMVGYRYYDTADTPLYYGFGHGLSYSRFVYKYMTVRPVTASAETGGTMDAPRYELAVTVKNDSLRTGKEVVQVYVAPKERQDDRPAHELRAFEKVELMPGEEKTVKLLLTAEAFSVYDEKQHAFAEKTGSYEIEVGSSSRDIRLRRDREHFLSHPGR